MYVHEILSPQNILRLTIALKLGLDALDVTLDCCFITQVGLPAYCLLQVQAVSYTHLTLPTIYSV